MTVPSGKNISLVLGGGGARGYAHIGVIRALEEQGLVTRSIAGCSMGALIGGIHAMGRLGEFERWALKVDRRQVFSLLDLSFGGGGLVKGQKVIGALRELVGEARIEELPVRYTAVASDLEREREVWIDQGPLFEAIRASISLPLFFTPVERDGVRLVDGGLFDPVPMAPTYRDMTDLTVAVSLSGPAGGWEPEAPGIEQVEETSPLGALLKRPAFWADRGEKDDGGWDLSYVVSQSIDAMQGLITRYKLAAHPPDVLIEIPRDACGILEFDRAGELIELGYARARERLAALR